MYRKFNIVSAVIVILSLVLSACGSATAVAPTQSMPTQPVAPTATEGAAAEPTATKQMAAEPTAGAKSGTILPEIDPGTLSGDIVAAGSSTVYPLAERIAERFKEEGFTEDKGKINLASVGTGGGFERFCTTGETDIANASRKIKNSEKENCAAIGRTPIEFRVGTDALAVVVSKENDFVTDVTLEELAKIFSNEAVKWSDIRPEWPNEDILRFAPGTDSGTFDYFIEMVMAPAHKVDDKANVEAGEAAFLAAGNLQQSEDDNVLVQGVLGSPYAIGFFGFAYYNENRDQMKALSINGVAPTEETAESNEYSLSRPLFIYSDANVMKEKPQVAAFINFFLTYVNDEILDVGYFPASDEALDAAKQAWLDAMK